jgi:hypothetical protein
MRLKKIFHGFNMNGNKIAAATVDEPTLAGNPVPLDYLQESQTYDTDAAETQEDSPVLPWAKQVQGKSLKPLLDQILFPIVNPIWTEPIFHDVKLTVIGEYFTAANKHLLFLSGQRTMRLNYLITPGDRISGVTARLTVTKNDNSTQIFNSTTTSDTDGTVNFTFDFTDIKSMVLSKVWQASTATKNDNYGNPYKPVEFNSNYTSAFDVWSLLNATNVVSSPMLYRAITDETGYDAGITDPTNFTSLIGWTTDKSFFLQPGNNMFTVLIPEDLFDNCFIYAIFGNDNQLVDKSFLAPSVEGITAFGLNYFGDTIPYRCCTIDFGWFAAQQQLDFQYIANTDNA